MPKKIIFSFITLTLLIILLQIPAFATTATISVSGTRGVTTVSGSATFPIDPITGQTGGSLSFYVDGGYIAGASTTTSTLTHYTLYNSIQLIDGPHTFSAKATAKDGTIAWSSTVVTTYNTPEITINSPSGTVRGVVNCSVAYNFPSSPRSGVIFAYLVKAGIIYSHIASKDVALSASESTNGIFDFTFDSTAWPDDNYQMQIKAYVNPLPQHGIINVKYSSKNIIIDNIIPRDKQTPKSKTLEVGEPINVANGNMSTSETDILIPARGLPLELSRTYNSQDDFIGSFGWGWRSNFDITLAEQPDNSVIEVDEKGVYTIYTKNPDGTYKPSAGKYSILTKNPDGTFILLRRKHGRKLYFDTTGRLIKIEERNGNAINISRTSNGVISEVTDSSGRKLLFTQDSQGRIIQVTDPKERIFKYEYDSNGNLIKSIDPLNNQTLYHYDNNHNFTQQTDANGHSLYFEYDASDRAYHSWQDGNNNEVTLSFDPANRTTIATDSLGNITKYEYNDYGLVTKIIDSQNNVQTFIWDSNLNKTSSTNQSGFTTTFTYDTRGNLLTIKDPLNNTTTFTYAYEPDFDFVNSITDALGNKTEYLYDARGNLVQVKDALNNTTNYSYDAQGQLSQLEDANGNITNFNYDSYGNLIQITDALNNQTVFNYDVIGNVTQITDAKGNSTQFNYDLLNRLTKITYPDNSKVIYSYDAVGNLISFVDPNHNTTSYTYDVVNRLAQITDALGNLTQYTYDIEGNRLSIIDANLNKTQYFYDSLNRLIKTIDLLNNQTLFNYDPAGNLISKTNANGNTISYTYDKNNRLTQIAYPDSSTISFTYDALGRRASMTDSTGITAYSYDALSRLTQVDGPQANDTVSYAYNKVGNRIQMINQDGGITTYTYDDLNRLLSLTDPQGKTTTYSYDSTNDLIQISYPNNTQANYTFDNLNRLISLTNQAGLDTISSYAYDYNPSGMRTKVTLANGDYILYSYDNLNRLTQEKRYSQNNELLYSFSYTYDSTGNRLTQGIDFKEEEFKIKGFPKKATLEYAYNQDNQLTQLKVYKIEEEDKTKLHKITSYTYDQNGNLIQEITLDEENQTEETKTFNYDYENRLTNVRITEEDGEIKTLDFIYDGLGRRISQVVTETEEDESQTQTHFYLYDGLNIIIEKDQTNQTLTVYTRGLSYGGGIGGIISLNTIDEEEQLYYHYDGLGSVTDLTDPQAQPKINYTYDAFGNILEQRGSRGINPYTFSTKEQDKSGLIYFGARYYEPRVGRWITKDPLTWGADDARIIENPINPALLIFNTVIRQEGELDLHLFNFSYWKVRILNSILRIGSFNPDNLHRYIYCFNNPINLIDPFGLYIEPVPIWEDPIFWAVTGTTMWIKGEFIIIGRFIGRYSRPVVIGVVSRLWHWGIRLDFPEIGKWFHIHWPWNKGSW